MTPSPGRIVQYTLSAQDVAQINQRRSDARARNAWHNALRSGAVVHSGNDVTAGDNYPLIITRVWSDTPTEETCVNGQVLLDGNDTLWVTSVQQGDGDRHFREFPRV